MLVVADIGLTGFGRQVFNGSGKVIDLPSLIDREGGPIFNRRCCGDCGIETQIKGSREYLQIGSRWRAEPDLQPVAAPFIDPIQTLWKRIKFAVFISGCMGIDNSQIDLRECPLNFKCTNIDSAINDPQMTVASLIELNPGIRDIGIIPRINRQTARQ